MIFLVYTCIAHTFASFIRMTTTMDLWPVSVLVSVLALRQRLELPSLQLPQQPFDVQRLPFWPAPRPLSGAPIYTRCIH